jgi:hypothetical protein
MAETLDLLCDKELVACGQFLLQGGQLCELSNGNWQGLYTWSRKRHAWIAADGGQVAAHSLELVATGESEDDRRKQRSLKLTLIGDGGARLKRSSVQVRFSSARGELALLTREDGRSFELSRDGKLWAPLRQRDHSYDRIYLQAFEQVLPVLEVAILPQPRGRLSELAERSSLPA